MYVYVCLSLLLAPVEAAPQPEVLYIILSQPGQFHQQMANTTVQSIRRQSRSFGLPQPDVLLSSVDFPPPYDAAALAVFPLLNPLLEFLKRYNDIEWVVILNENTDFLLKRFLDLLQEKFLSTSEPIFLGSSVPRLSPTSSGPYTTFPHPDQEEAIILSRSAVMAIEGYLDREYIFNNRQLSRKSQVVIIDSGALEEIMASEGVQFQDIVDVWPGGAVSQQRPAPSCGKVESSSIMFAVKTCSSHHHTRVQAIQQTWARLTEHIEFYSDLEDPMVPTVRLEGTVEPRIKHFPNIFGCNKTFAILQRFLDTDLEWLVLVDDDTMLSVTRMRELLACYTNQEYLVLGLKTASLSLTGEGVTFPTGGAGTVFNRAAVRTFVAGCVCSHPTLTVLHPDGSVVDGQKDPGGLEGVEDLMLGVCAHLWAKLPITNSFRLFQDAATDFDPAWLSSKEPISFHHHGQADGDFLQVYEQWFGSSGWTTNLQKEDL